MLDRLKVMNFLNEMYAETLSKVGFIPNKGMDLYKYKIEEGEFAFKFIFNRKNALHITFSYTDFYLGEKMIEIEDIITNKKNLSLPVIKNKTKHRPCISITDWLHPILDNGSDPMHYDKWLLRIDNLDDLQKTRETYEEIFSLVENKIINKIKSKEDLYNYLSNEKYKYSLEYKFLLLISKVMNNKNIKDEYQKIQSSKRYVDMVASARNNIDLTFTILSNDEILLP